MKSVPFVHTGCQLNPIFIAGLSMRQAKAPPHYSPKRCRKPCISRPEQSQRYGVGRNEHLSSSVVHGAGEALLAAGRIHRS